MTCGTIIGRKIQPTLPWSTNLDLAAVPPTFASTSFVLKAKTVLVTWVVTRLRPLATSILQSRFGLLMQKNELRCVIDSVLVVKKLPQIKPSFNKVALLNKSTNLFVFISFTMCSRKNHLMKTIARPLGPTGRTISMH